MNKKEMITRINSFSKLKKNWDSYSAKPINKKTINFAKSIVPILEENDGWFVAPCSGGSITFELDNKKILLMELWGDRRRKNVKKL